MSKRDLTQFPWWNHRGWWIHKKTGNRYLVVGCAINATNENEGQVVVQYQKDGQHFIREESEFLEKFEKESL